MALAHRMFSGAHVGVRGLVASEAVVKVLGDRARQLGARMHGACGVLHKHVQ